MEVVETTVANMARNTVLKSYIVVNEPTVIASNTVNAESNAHFDLVPRRSFGDRIMEYIDTIARSCERPFTHSP